MGGGGIGSGAREEIIKSLALSANSIKCSKAHQQTFGVITQSRDVKAIPQMAVRLQLLVPIKQQLARAKSLNQLA